MWRRRETLSNKVSDTNYEKRLDHFIWSCTRAYPAKHAYSLGDGKALPNELNTNEAKSLIKKAADFGVDNFFITGAGWTGEPLMRKDFIELIRCAADFDLEPYVKVTGWHFDDAVAQELAAGNCKAIISLAGLREVDALLRGEGSFEDSINAARLCHENGVPFALSVINTKYVVNQVSDLITLALNLGAKGFHLASIIPQPICVEEQLTKLGPLEPTPEAKEKQLNEVYQLNKTVHDKILIVPYEMFNNRILKTREPARELHSMCSLCDNLVKNEWLEILDDGKAYGCAPLNLVFGDIRKDSIKEIMSRMRDSDVIKKLADRGNLKGKCGICEFKNICGGCRARAYIYSNDSLNQDPACAYRPKNQKMVPN